MAEGQPQPAPEDVQSTPETGSSEDVGTFITSLVEQQTHSHDEDEEAKYNSPETRVYGLLMDLRSTVADEWHPTVAHVFLGYGSLVYDKLPATKQAIFLSDARRYQMHREGADLELTQQEGEILKNITHAIGIEYDPGEAGNPEKRTFRLADIEAKAPDRAKVRHPFDKFLDAQW